MPNNPSEYQLKAITHDTGPAMVIAGPGSGKTFTLTERLLFLTQELRIEPTKILVLTFSKAVAFEMQKRSIDRGAPDGIFFGTFHSFSFYLLKSFFGFNSLTVISNKQKLNILKNIITTLGFSDHFSGYDTISTFVDNMSKAKNTCTKNESVCLTDEQTDLLVKQYYQYLRDNDYIDFDDMLNLCYDSLISNKAVLNRVRGMFDYIIIDEFQDINNIQYKLVKLVAEPKNNVFAVGDDDQAIYGFRGSSPLFMRKFIKEYENTEILYLSDNYRSKETIISFAKDVISKNKNRFIKNIKGKKTGGNVFYKLFDTRHDEEKYLIDILGKLDRETQSKSVVLLRTNREVNIYASLLAKNGIPVSILEVKQKNKVSFVLNDIYHFLKFVYEGQKREDFLLFMNKPERFIQRNALVNDVVKEKDLLAFYKNNDNVCDNIKNLFSKIYLCQKMNKSNAVKIFVKSIGYEKYIKEHSNTDEDYAMFIAEANKIIENLKSYDENLSLDDFVHEKENVENKENQDFGIHIMTMHNAKGLEFENVYLPDLNEGIIPSKNMREDEIEEERRLLYVALTRAKENLYLFASDERNRDVSRFIKPCIFKAITL